MGESDLPPPLALTTVALHGFCDMRIVDFEEWPEFWDDMQADIEDECKEYGDLVCLKIDREAPLCSVFVRFKVPSQAKLCYDKMHKRAFAGRRVTAELQDNKFWENVTDCR